MTAYRGMAALLATLLVVSATSIAKADDILPVEIRCSALSVSPEKNPSFTTKMTVSYSNYTLHGERSTTEQPGRESFDGRVAPDGSIQITGQGNYTYGKSSPWRFDFAGAVKPDEVILKGMMHSTTNDKVTRFCSFAFAMPPAKAAEILLPAKAQERKVAQLSENQRALEAKQDQLKQSQAASAIALNDKQKVLETNQQKLDQQQTRTGNDVKSVEAVLGGIILPVNADPKSWMMRVSAVPVQQQQFCRIVDRFHDDLTSVYSTRNEIKINALYRDRRRDMAALLPKGDFANWVVQIKEVKQTADGSAGVILQPPCRVMLGSDICPRSGGAIQATIPQDSAPFYELSRVNAGDFVVISGKVLYDESMDGTQSAQNAVYPAGTYCAAGKENNQDDVFVTKIDYLVQLK